MSWRALLPAFVVLPGVFAWWSGRQLVRRHDDAALAERLLARQQHAQHVMFLSSVLVVVAAGPYAGVAVLALVLGAWIGDYPSRRVLLDERWTLATCLRWQGRFSVAWLGLAFMLLLAPSVIQAAGPLRWPVAAALALVLGLWAHQYTPTFLWLVRAAPMPWPPGWQALSESSHARRPHLLRMPVPGGRFVSAFAFPSTRAPSVLFTDPALELLSAREQTAVFAHELSHLEHGDRRRCHIAAAISYALVAGATLGAALAFDWLPPGLFISFWSIALIVAFAWRRARQKAHETESDLRALALCNDAEALISGLTKLTMAGRLPRRWSSELEHGASHPSLARRLHGIRRAAGIAPAPSPLEEPLVVPTTRAGAFVTLDLERVWVNDVRYPAQKAPKFLRRKTGSAWSAAYADLVELRIRASWRGGAALVARDRTGRSRGVTIAADDVATLQRRLDAVEPRLAHDVLLPEPPALVGRFTALALWIVSVDVVLTLAVIIGLIGMIRPSRAALAAVAGVAGACGVILVADLGMLSDLGVHGDGWRSVASAAGAGLVAAVAGWLAVQPRTFDWRPADYLPVVGALAVIVALTWGPLAAYLVRTSAPPTAIVQTLGGAPLLWASLVALGAALLPARPRGLRWSGAALLAVSVLGGAGAILVDRLAISRPIVVGAPAGDTGPLPRMAQIELPSRVGVLRVSPLGSRVAVWTREARGTPDRFLVLGLSGERSQVEARDLRFIDESNALVLVESMYRDVLQHLELDSPSSGSPGWSIDLPHTTGTTVSSIRGSAWAVVGYDTATQDFIGLVGRVGDADFKKQRWAFDESERVDGETVEISPDGRGFRAVSELAPLAQLQWGPLIYGGRVARQSRVWRLDAGRQDLVATWPITAACRLVGPRAEDVVCIGEHKTRTLIWRFSLQAGPTRPLVVPDMSWRSGISPDGRFVALWGRESIVLVDLERGQAVRRPLPQEPGLPQQLIPLADRLITLFRRPRSAPVLEVYDARW